jgi:hypothetical protein
VIVVEMHMHSGHDVSLKIVLDMGEFPGQTRHVMVVHERDGGNGFPILVPLLPDQIVPDQVADRFGAVRVVAPFDQTVEIGKKILIERHAESRKLFHGRDFSVTKLIIVARIIQSPAQMRQAAVKRMFGEAPAGGIGPKRELLRNHLKRARYGQQFPPFTVDELHE